MNLMKQLFFSVAMALSLPLFAMDKPSTPSDESDKENAAQPVGFTTAPIIRPKARRLVASAATVLKPDAFETVAQQAEEQLTNHFGASYPPLIGMKGNARLAINRHQIAHLGKLPDQNALTGILHQIIIKAVTQEAHNRLTKLFGDDSTILESLKKMTQTQIQHYSSENSGKMPDLNTAAQMVQSAYRFTETTKKIFAQFNAPATPTTQPQHSQTISTSARKAKSPHRAVSSPVAFTGSLPTLVEVDEAASARAPHASASPHQLAPLALQRTDSRTRISPSGRQKQEKYQAELTVSAAACGPTLVADDEDENSNSPLISLDTAYRGAQKTLAEKALKLKLSLEVLKTNITALKTTLKAIPNNERTAAKVAQMIQEAADRMGSAESSSDEDSDDDLQRAIAESKETAKADSARSSDQQKAKAEKKASQANNEEDEVAQAIALSLAASPQNETAAHQTATTVSTGQPVPPMLALQFKREQEEEVKRKQEENAKKVAALDIEGAISVLRSTQRPVVNEYAAIEELVRQPIYTPKEQRLIDIINLWTLDNATVVDNALNSSGYMAQKTKEKLSDLARVFRRALESIPQKTVDLGQIKPFQVTVYDWHLEALIMPNTLHDSLHDLRSLLNYLVPVINKIRINHLNEIHVSLKGLIENANSFAAQVQND